MTFTISSNLSRASQTPLLTIPRRTSSVHKLSDQETFCHPHTAIFMKYGPDLIQDSLRAEGLLPN
jgi:hypothetical protein